MPNGRHEPLSSEFCSLRYRPRAALHCYTPHALKINSLSTRVTSREIDERARECNLIGAGHFRCCLVWFVANLESSILAAGQRKCLVHQCLLLGKCTLVLSIID